MHCTLFHIIMSVDILLIYSHGTNRQVFIYASCDHLAGVGVLSEIKIYFL